jgi:hypothetical protein
MHPCLWQHGASTFRGTYGRSATFHLLYHNIKIAECGVIVKHHLLVLLNNGLSCVTCGKYVKWMLQFCEVMTFRNNEIISNHYTKANQPQWYQVIITHARVWMCLKSGLRIILPNQATLCGNSLGTPIGWATKPGRSVTNIAEHDEVGILHYLQGT